MRRRELADDYDSREAAGIMTCGETYFMALRTASWDRQTNTPHPSKAEKKPKEKQTENHVDAANRSNRERSNMNESRSKQKCETSFNSLVKMSAQLMTPGI